MSHDPADPLSKLLLTIDHLQSAYAAQSAAWAHRVKSAGNAHLAAVMGPCMSRHCRESSEWTARDGIRSDPVLSGAIQASSDPDTLRNAVEGHVQWLMQEIESGMSRDASLTGPYSDPTDVATQAEAWSKAQANHLQEVQEIEEELRRVREEAEAVRGQVLARTTRGFSQQRAKVINAHSTQISHVLSAARELAFCDKANEAVEADIFRQKQGHSTSSSDARAFFSSASYTALQAERKRIESERSHIELSLQSYFDHYAQGASRSESTKPERVKLQLAAELKSGKSGYKQIQLIDAYCLGRGNEMWAIMPDLMRVGHDVDPITFLHWQPPLEDAIAADLRQYRREQNATFAQRLLTLLSSAGLRAEVLAERPYGANKLIFKPSPDDGCAIYWVILQMFHPIDRDERRRIERELNSAHTKFRSGNPHPAVQALRSKVREGLDIAARIRWDSAALPLIDTLSTRDSLFTVELSEFRDRPSDPEDSITDMDPLVSKIEEVINTLDTAKKDWNERSAMSAQTTELQSLRKRLSSLEAAQSKPSGKGKAGKALAAQSDTKPGFCMKKGCGRKIEKYKQGCGWKLCSTCLLEVRKTGKSAQLTDGTEWTLHKALSCLGQMRANGVSNIPESKRHPGGAHQAKRAMSLKRLAEGEVSGDESDESDPDTDLDAAPTRHVKFADGTKAIMRRLKGKTGGKGKRSRKGA